MEKCPECAGTVAREWVESITEPLDGKRLTYGSRYYSCSRCRVTWYSAEQMTEQMVNRRREVGSYLRERLNDPAFRKLFFAGNLPRERL